MKTTPASDTANSLHLSTDQLTAESTNFVIYYGVVPKGLLTFRGFFMHCGVKSLLDTSGIYPGTYSLGLFAGLFSDAMGYNLPIVSCEMTRTK